jgi:L-threonylcarbamoyladenylate synthase
MRVTLKQAVEFLQQGRVVALPTETVYGLAASLDHPSAIEAIYRLKGRPSNNPLIIHLAEWEQLVPYAPILLKEILPLARHFWPGPLTLVIAVDPLRVLDRVRAGLPTAAFRIPRHPLISQIIKKVGPIVMPSANLSGKPSATCAEHVEADFGEDFPVLDGGPCQEGVESTILYWNGKRWQIARLGALAQEQFLPVLGYLPEVVESSSKDPICPGQLYRHYAPSAILHLEREKKRLSGVVLGYMERVYPLATRLFVLGTLTDSKTVAENLYATLRQLDIEGIVEAHVDIDIPQNGLWITIAERLLKAASHQPPSV